MRDGKILRDQRQRVEAGMNQETGSQERKLTSGRTCLPAVDSHCMPIYQLERTQTISLGIEACWRFFSDPRNLRKITPPEMNFRIKRDLPPAVYPGLMIEYTVSPLFGIPLTWLTEIVHVDAPHRFVDEQRVGPYRIWHHEHTSARSRKTKPRCTIS